MDMFTTHELQMKKGDVVYLYSDGYGDQFGGPKQKKYKSQRFKKFLHSISCHELEVQKNMLDEEFDQWMGSNEQIDDILVFGIKL
jgi:serine phosphatase RsbU (regulator of sigma subunit)